MPKITPCLWFDNQAEEAANFYTSIFKISKIGNISRYGKEGYETHGREAGTVLNIDFEIEGQRFTGLNGGPVFKFNEAISFVVHCKRNKWIITGKNYPKAEMKRHSNAVGSRINTASRGKSSPMY